MPDPIVAQQIPDERIFLAAATLAQSTLVEKLNLLTPKAAQFLKYRMITGSDAAAMHLFGHPRPDGDMTKKCRCGDHKPGWLDLREQTVWRWKQNPDFAFVYNTMLREPLMFAATRLEQLSLAAIGTYEQILGPNSDAKPSVKRLAARDMLQSNNLLDVEGVNKRSAPGSKVQETMAMRMAKERLMRGLELSLPQQKMLRDAGFQIPERMQLALAQGGAQGGATERALDGSDVSAYDEASMLPD